MTFQRIFAALDRSELAPEVFTQALHLAQNGQPGAALKLFHCLPLDSQLLSPYASGAGEELLGFAQNLQERLQGESQEIGRWLGDYAQQAQAAGVKAEWDWAMGEPGRQIRDLAQRWDADLIIIGRRGLRGFAEMVLGSVSNYIVHHSPCSVLIIQPPRL
ncbi:MAG: universal stress protein [Cyanobacteriota bacterium]|jgi:nucleotide-binding universal stress UspA family protein